MPKLYLQDSLLKRQTEAELWFQIPGTPEYVKALWFKGMHAKSRKQALKYFAEAANFGHAGACCKMMHYHQHRSREVALQFFEKAIQTANFNTEYYNQESYLKQLEYIKKVI